MFRKSLTKIAIVAAFGLAVFAVTAATAMADSGSATFGMDRNGRYGYLSTTDAICNLNNHRVTFDSWLQTPPQYTTGIWFTEEVDGRDVSANGRWFSTGQVTTTRPINTNWGSGDGSINQPVKYAATNWQGISGHYYEFRVYIKWAPPGGYWSNWLYYTVDPFTWIFQNGSAISGYLYCHL